MSDCDFSKTFLGGLCEAAAYRCPGLAVHLPLFLSETVVLSMEGVGAVRVSALGRAWALGLTGGGSPGWICTRFNHQAGARGIPDDCGPTGWENRSKAQLG